MHGTNIKKWWGDKAKENKMGEVWGKQGAEKKCCPSSAGKNLKDKPTLRRSRNRSQLKPIIGQ